MSNENNFIYLLITETPEGEIKTVFESVVESRLIFCSTKIVQVDWFTSHNGDFWRN